jgi:hypothetical protein
MAFVVRDVDPTPKVGRCDVCVLVHQRETEVPVTYCGLCDAWICAPCKGSWTWRMVAAAKRLLQKEEK